MAMFGVWGGSGLARAAGSAPAGHDKPEFVRLNPLVVQLVGPGGLRRNVAISLSLELAAGVSRNAIIDVRPKLRALIFESWASPPLVVDGNRHYDIGDIKRRVLRVSESVLGPDRIAAVLIDEIREVLVR